MYKLFLCLRYLRKRRIAFFAVAAVSLCVAMVLIVVSVMGGFLQMVKDRSRGMLGDLIVENGALQGFPYYDDLIKRVKGEMGDQIAEATPVIITYSVLRFPDTQRTDKAQVVGIRLEETYQVNDFKNGLFYEKYYPGTTTLADQKLPRFGFDEQHQEILPPDLEAAWQRWWKAATPQEREKVPISDDVPYKRPGYYYPSPKWNPPAWTDKAIRGAIMGTDMCARRLPSGDYERFCYRGELISLTFVPLSTTGQIGTGTSMPSRAFRYTDDSRTGVYDIDSTSVYVDFSYLQSVLKMDDQKLDEEHGGGIDPARTTQIQIKLKPGVNANAARKQIMEKWVDIREQHIKDVQAPRLLEDVEVFTWEEKQARFIAAVEKEKYLVTVLFGVISVVAIFLVGCIFYMIVQQKTRDIGIVKSVGATALGVANIFLAYGAAVGVVGGAVGSAIGIVFVWYINDIQDALAKINPELRIWSPEVYAFDRIPNQVKPTDAVVIYVIAIVASMVGSVIAAYRAARIWPVEALSL